MMMDDIGGLFLGGFDVWWNYFRDFLGESWGLILILVFFLGLVL